MAIRPLKTRLFGQPLGGEGERILRLEERNRITIAIQKLKNIRK